MNLNEILRVNHEQEFDTEKKCVAFLEKLRWPEGVSCPACDSQKISRIHARGRNGKVRLLYQCLQKPCRYQFSATTNTIFHDSHLPLNKWFKAIALIANPNERISTNQLRLILGIQYKTAQNVAQRIHDAIRDGSIEAGSGYAPHSGKEPSVISKSSERLLQNDRIGVPKAYVSSKPVPAKRSDASTVGTVLNMFTSMAQFTLKSPLFFANYLITKISLDT